MLFRFYQYYLTRDSCVCVDPEGRMCRGEGSLRLRLGAREIDGVCARRPPARGKDGGGAGSTGSSTSACIEGDVQSTARSGS